jgi:type IV pilus assembly protein PilB
MSPNSVDLRGVTIPPAVIEKVPESVARENVIIPLMETNGILQIVMSDPSDYETLLKLQFILNKSIQPVLAPKEQIVEAINRHYRASA